jgi:alkanesulfonate monooxygenase SsuD/methylene tetrahydromethanopterin reductase-like flavin-dependent oxidoreductase (luciferase family)
VTATAGGQPVRVGLFLTNQHPPGADMMAALAGEIRLVHRARDHGWDSVWGGQHYLPEGMAMTQPVPFLARLAAETGDMRVGMGILLLALANPVHVAETFATLDVITGGRLVFGVGLGYRDVEYDAFAIPRADRVRRFEENLRLVEALWTQNRVSADLPWCRLDDVTPSIRPVQRPRPPIWFAANSDRAVARAARLGDTWIINPHATTDLIRRQLDLFADIRAAAGRGPVVELPAIKEVFCAPTRREALELARPHLERKYRTYASWGQDKALPGDESFAKPFEELERERFIIGSPEDCLGQLLVWRRELGVNHFIFRTHWSGMPVESSLASIDLLSREVLPELQATVPAGPV